ncbi:MAG: FHA domain-containing protein [Lentisphaeria bacterium]|jgi:predicted component of type VI protein secretion system
MSKLVCVGGLNKGDEFSLLHGSNLIGRAKDCQISLFDKKSSRRHCRISREGNYYAIEDLSSRNGTALNGKLLAKTVILKSGDKIKIGGTVLVFSDQTAGGILEHAVADAAAEVHEKDFGKAFKNASSRAAAVHQHHQAQISHDLAEHEQDAKAGFFARLFRCFRHH